MGDESYRAGRIDQELKGINTVLGEIKRKLDDNIAWQNDVDSRSTAQAIRLHNVEIIGRRNADNIENLRDKDRGVLALASTIGGILGGAISILIKIFGGGQ
jgi:hypothetical protein